MRTCPRNVVASRIAHDADFVALLDHLPHVDVNLAQVGVHGIIAKILHFVLNNNVTAVGTEARFMIYVRDLPRQDRVNCVSGAIAAVTVDGFDVNSLVKASPIVAYAAERT